MEGVLYLFAKGGTIVTEKPKKKKKDIYSILLLFLGIGLIAAGIIGIISSRTDSKEYKNSTDIRKIPPLLMTFQPTTVRMIPEMLSIQHINLKFHMLLTEKPIRENVKNVSGQGRAATKKNIPMIN